MLSLEFQVVAAVRTTEMEEVHPVETTAEATILAIPLVDPIGGASKQTGRSNKKAGGCLEHIISFTFKA